MTDHITNYIYKETAIFQTERKKCSTSKCLFSTVLCFLLLFVSISFCLFIVSFTNYFKEVTEKITVNIRNTAAIHGASYRNEYNTYIATTIDQPANLPTTPNSNSNSNQFKIKKKNRKISATEKLTNLYSEANQRVWLFNTKQKGHISLCAQFGSFSSRT